MRNDPIAQLAPRIMVQTTMLAGMISVRFGGNSHMKLKYEDSLGACASSNLMFGAFSVVFDTMITILWPKALL